MSILAKRNSLYFTKLFIFCIFFNCTEFTRMYLVLFMVLSIENGVKELHNPGKVFVRISHSSQPLGRPKYFP